MNEDDLQKFHGRAIASIQPYGAWVRFVFTDGSELDIEAPEGGFDLVFSEKSS